MKLVVTDDLVIIVVFMALSYRYLKCEIVMATFIRGGKILPAHIDSVHRGGKDPIREECIFLHI
jgi:hypothetical protein